MFLDNSDTHISYITWVHIKSSTLPEHDIYITLPEKMIIPSKPML